MKTLTLALYHAVMESYDHAKPWGVDWVKLTIGFDRSGRVVSITYIGIPPEHEDRLLERVREVCQPHGQQFSGTLVNVVVGFRNPNRN